jgi:uncharacterized delta-60 repeat protein
MREICLKNTLYLCVFILSTFFIYPLQANAGSLGTINTDFADDGIVLEDFDYEKVYLWGQSIAIDSDGRIVVATYGREDSDADYDFIIARYDTDGELDESFSDNGYKSVNFSEEKDGDDSSDYVSSITILEDGTIAVAGHTYHKYENDDGYDMNSMDMAILFLDEDGDEISKHTVNFGFFDDAADTYDEAYDDYAFSVTHDTEGRVILGGYTKQLQDDYSQKYLFALARFEFGSEWQLDEDFGTDGIDTIELSGITFHMGSVSVATNSSDEIFIAGYTNNGTDNDFTVVKYDYDGSHATLIKDIYGSTETVNALYMNEDDELFAAGYGLDGSDIKLIVAKIEDNGSSLSLDESFGEDGTGYVDYRHDDSPTYANAVTTDSNGNVVVGGYIYNGDGYGSLIVRYDADGILDDDFASSGAFQEELSEDNDYIHGLVTDENNSIYALGYTYSNSDSTGDLALINIYGYDPDIEEDCEDGIDNNGDSKIDCDDSQCTSENSACVDDSETSCDDGEDNDGDDNIDCEDSDCIFASACDVDGDDDIDCSDPDNAGDTDCLTVSINPLDLGDDDDDDDDGSNADDDDEATGCSLTNSSQTKTNIALYPLILLAILILITSRIRIKQKRS